MTLSNGYVACQVSAEMDSSSTGCWDCISSVCNSAWLRIIKRGAEKNEKDGGVNTEHGGTGSKSHSHIWYAWVHMQGKCQGRLAAHSLICIILYIGYMAYMGVNPQEQRNNNTT